MIQEFNCSAGDDKYFIRVQTPDGTVVFPISPGGVIARGPHYAVYESNPETKPKKITAKANKRASIRQETEVMEALGGRRQTGSGSVAHLKGDGRVRNKYRVEAKYTRRGSYHVTRKELSKIRGECYGTEIPLFIIDFVDPQTGGAPDRWVIVEFEHFRKMEYPHAAHHPPGSSQT